MEPENLRDRAVEENAIPYGLGIALCAVLVFAVVPGCDRGGTISDDLTVRFERVGNFTDKAELGDTVLLTYYIDTSAPIDPDDVPWQLWQAIEEHGRTVPSRDIPQLMSVETFYYLHRSDTPDVSRTHGWVNAMDRAYRAKPLAVVTRNGLRADGLLRHPKGPPTKYKGSTLEPDPRG